MAFQGQLTGNIGRDPELRALSSGQMVTTFSVAVRQPKKQGQDQPPFWVKVECWGKTAEYAANYLKKGDSVFCVGTVTMEEFTKRDGTQGFANVLKNANVEKFSGRDGDAPAPAAAAAPAPVAAPVVQQAAASLATATAGVVIDDDLDIPF